MKKRLLTIAAILALCLALLSATALAAGEHNDHSGWKPLSGTLDTISLESGNSYYLSGDVTVNSPITVTGTVTLCLNGHVLDLGGQNISVDSGAALTLCDCTSVTTNGYLDSDGLWHPGSSTGEGATPCNLTSGVLTGGSATSGGGVYVYGTFTMEGGAIAGNTAQFGGGVCVLSNGSFNMSGGAITGNTGNTASHGGGVYVYGTFTMSGGSITGNTANYGGGVYVTNNGTFTMSGGSITGNTAIAGGGVYVYGTFTMTVSAAITDNPAAKTGGGVYMSGGTFNLSGGAAITDNTGTSGNTANNVYLASNKTITIAGQLTNTTPIGVSMDSPGAFTSGWKDQMGENADPAKYFTSEQTGYHVALSEGEAALAANTYTVTFEANGGDGTMTNQTFTYSQEQALTANDFTRTGYTFAGWSKTENGPVEYTDGARVNNLAESGTVTLYAQWTAHTYTVKFDPNGGSGDMADQDFTYDVPQALAPNGFSRTWYTFTGWNTEKDGSGASYEDQAQVRNLTGSGTVTLYAQWKFAPPFLGHSIATVTDGNGTVTVNPNAAKGGETVTITATPKEGYKVGTITVTSILGKNVPVTGNTFIMPDCSVTVKVTFVKADRVNPFTDVAENSWYYEGVMYVYENGLMNGTGDGTTFSPAMNLNRAMLMTILARMDGEDTTGGDTWYSKGLEWAVANGISDGTNPDADITREQMVTMLYRYVGSPAVSGDLSAFTDGDSTSDWAKDAVIWAVQKGLLQGNDGKLTPTGTATRMEVATILMRFCENVLGK